MDRRGFVAAFAAAIATPQSLLGKMATVDLQIDTPEWALPFLEPSRYKGAKGGRAGGKSHFFAELAVEEMLCNPSMRFVCIREIQRSLRFSVKSLVESKIRQWGLEGSQFEILSNEIRRIGGPGVMIFEGMQDHTADSIKSLEAFDRAWVEEAQAISRRSLDLLLPTIRAPGSEIWFSWNPDQPDDPIDQFLVANPPDNSVVIHVNYDENPFIDEAAVKEAERLRSLDPDAFEHIWLGGYNVKSDSKVLAGKYVVEEFDVTVGWHGPYHGCDHGFAQDPRTLVKCWIGPHPKHGPRCLYIEHESYQVGLSIDRTAERWAKDVPDFARYTVRAESAEPGTNDFLRRHGVPRIEGVKKWQGAVEDGIAHLKSYDKIVIHPRCKNTATEARLYSYKVDKHTGDIKPDIEDRHNHIWDAVRYALAPLIKPGRKAAYASW